MPAWLGFAAQLIGSDYAASVTDGFKEDGAFVIVMEAADSSETLADILQKHRAKRTRMDELEARAIAKVDNENVLKIYEDHAIDDLLVVDSDGCLVGAIDIQDLPKLKIL